MLVWQSVPAAMLFISSERIREVVANPAVALGEEIAEGCGGGVFGDVGVGVGEHLQGGGDFLHGQCGVLVFLVG